MEKVKKDCACDSCRYSKSLCWYSEKCIACSSNPDNERMKANYQADKAQGVRQIWHKRRLKRSNYMAFMYDVTISDQSDFDFDDPTASAVTFRNVDTGELLKLIGLAQDYDKNIIIQRAYHSEPEAN